jgi:2-haloacid dehalogenase
LVGERWASFDCYGTLVDWMGGISSTLARLWPEEDGALLLERYHEIEPRVQAGSGMPYRDVLRECLVLLAEHEGLALAHDEEAALAASLPSWPAFPEVPGVLAELRERGWRLAILSNTDPDLLDASLRNIGVPADLLVTAAHAGSYKPAHGHWERLFEQPAVDRSRHVHVAASLFHDVSPARDLGLTAVWINRLGEASALPRAAELTDLAGLPDTLDRLVPA